jgi:hypothetical protein
MGTASIVVASPFLVQDAPRYIPKKRSHVYVVLLLIIPISFVWPGVLPPFLFLSSTGVIQENMVQQSIENQWRLSIHSRASAGKAR